MNKIDKKIFFLEKEITDIYIECVKNIVTLLVVAFISLFSLNFFLYRRSSSGFAILFFLLSSIQMQRITSNYKYKSKYLGGIATLIKSFVTISCIAFFPNVNLIIFWLFVIPAALAVFYSSKKMLYFSCLFWVGSFLLKELFGAIHFQGHYFLTRPYSKNSLEHYSNTVLHFILSTIFLIYYLYYLSEIKKREYLINFLKEKRKEFNYLETVDKLQILFEKIEKHVKTNKKYLLPDYNLTDLAFDLNSNRTYVSKAINLKSNKNFKQYMAFLKLKDKKNSKKTKLNLYTKSFNI